MSDGSFQSALAEPAHDAGLRQAAVLVHALSTKDRRWALQQLAPARRDRVTALVEELDALGVPRQQALIEAATADVPALELPVEASREDGSPESTLNAWINANGAAALAAILAGEPPALIARVLGLRDWAWRAEALRHLQPAVRADVVEHLRADSASGDAASPGSPADEMVLTLLAGRVAAPSSAVPPLAEPAIPAIPARAAGLVARLRAWGRRS